MTKNNFKKLLREAIHEELAKRTLSESAPLPTDDPTWMAVDSTVGLIEKDPASKDWDIKADGNKITIRPKGGCILARRYNDQQLVSKGINNIKRQVNQSLMGRAMVSFSFDPEFEAAKPGRTESVDASAFIIEIEGAR